MELIIVVIFIVSFWYIYSSSKRNNANKAQYLTPPIPKGFQIYDHGTIRGLNFRKENVRKFIKGTNHTISLEREPHNEHDPNAIKVIGQNHKFTGFLGYIPKEISERIIKSNLFSDVQPRLKKLYLESTGYAEIDFDIIGPKASKDKYK